jgi:RHS repeat-associated protein
MMDMQYVYTGGANNGRIAQSIDGVGNETVNYTYDALNRLAGAGATNGTWGQGYTYDGFGNLVGKAVTAGSAPVLSVSVDPATNRVVGQAYDANGNAGDGTTIYDVENRQIQGPGGAYVYDQAGKRVKKAYGTSWEFYFYGIGGQKLVTQACLSQESGLGCTAPQYNVYFGGKLVKSKGVVVVTDRLGSVRANSLGERMSYYPYGEEKTSTGDGREKFGTYTRDNVAQDYADQRYYAVGMGRFGSADPGGLATASLSNPTSWNRYSYTYGDPTNIVDRSGKHPCLIYGDPSECPDDEASTGGGGDQMLITNDGPMGGGSGGPGGGGALENAQGSLDRIANKTQWSTKCMDTLTAASKGGNVGQSVDLVGALKGAAASAVLSDGTSSQVKVQDLYAGAANPSLARLIDPAQTVASSFANSPSTSAMAALGGNAIYIRPDAFATPDNALNVATLMHELLHNLTGLTDPDLMRNLFPSGSGGSMGSFDISLRLFTDCVAQ